MESQEILTLSPEQIKAAQKRERRRLRRIDLQFWADRRQHKHEMTQRAIAKICNFGYPRGLLAQCTLSHI